MFKKIAGWLIKNPWLLKLIGKKVAEKVAPKIEELKKQ